MVTAATNLTAPSRTGQPARPLTPREAKIRRLSDCLVEVQRPLRILDAIKWEDDVERAFFAGGGRELPPVTRAYYLARPLPFDPTQKLQELSVLEDEIHQQLGDSDAPGQIMKRMCREYRDVVRMLDQRGTPKFVALSQQLYGSASDCLHPGEPKLVHLGQMMS